MSDRPRKVFMVKLSPYNEDFIREAARSRDGLRFIVGDYLKEVFDATHVETELQPDTLIARYVPPGAVDDDDWQEVTFYISEIRMRWQ